MKINVYVFKIAIVLSLSCSFTSEVFADNEDEETIVIVGNRLPVEPPPGFINPGTDPSAPGGGGGSGSEGGDNGGDAPEPVNERGETKEECEARLDAVTSNCQETYAYVGGTSLGVFCAVFSRYLGPAGTTICGGGASYTTSQAIQWCADMGDAAKADQCE